MNASLDLDVSLDLDAYLDFDASPDLDAYLALDASLYFDASLDIDFSLDLDAYSLNLDAFLDLYDFFTHVVYSRQISGKLPPLLSFFCWISWIPF